MEPGTDSQAPPRRLIDTGVKARFAAALRRGMSREAAAAAAGFPLKSFYGARARDPLFRLAWEWAMDLFAWYERTGRGVPPEEGGATVRIAPQGHRPLQRRRMSWVKFNESRQLIFLDHFAATADAGAAAAKAGVSIATVNAHRRRNPEFAAAWDEALAHAVALLEAEAVRQRLDAQRRLTENLNPTGEMTQEFERVIKLLARWDRKGGGFGPRPRPPVESQAWTFDDAIAALDKRLRALGLRKTGLPPPGGGASEGPGGTDGGDAE
ncbi:MAG TPA: hypothetical protein VGD66_11545 [Allosphingosinicella sp.]